MTCLFSTSFFHKTIFDVLVSTNDELEIFEKIWRSKETAKARQKSLPFKSLSFVEYLSLMEYFLYKNSTLMLKSLYNLNVCSVASIVRLHELNAGYFVWIHLKFK